MTFYANYSMKSPPDSITSLTQDQKQWHAVTMWSLFIWEMDNGDLQWSYSMGMTINLHFNTAPHKVVHDVQIRRVLGTLIRYYIIILSVHYSWVTTWESTDSCWNAYGHPLGTNQLDNCPQYLMYPPALILPPCGMWKALHDLHYSPLSKPSQLMEIRCAFLVYQTDVHKVIWHSVKLLISVKVFFVREKILVYFYIH